MKRALLAGLALVAFSVVQASAADLPVKARPMAPVAAAWSWNGAYIGVNAGWSWGKTTITDRDGYNTILGDTWSFNHNGFVGGGQIGWNWWMNPFLLGIEADLGYMGQRGNAAAPAGCRFFACDTIGSVKTDFYGTLRGRAGFTAGDLLLFVTGGGIGINQRTNVNDSCFVAPCGFAVINADDKSFRVGWTAGGGVEWHIPGTPWSLKGEWLYYDLGTKTMSAAAFFPPSPAPGGTFRWDTKTTGSIARVGANWHF